MLCSPQNSLVGILSGLPCLAAAELLQRQLAVHLHIHSNKGPQKGRQGLGCPLLEGGRLKCMLEAMTAAQGSRLLCYCRE